MATRSTQLCFARLTTTGWNAPYVVPAGVVVIVKSLSATSWAPATGQLVLQFTRHDGGSNVRVFNGPIANSEFKAADGWWVLNPGDQITTFTDQQPIDVLVSGAELPSP